MVLNSGWLHVRISWGALKTLLPISESLMDLAKCPQVIKAAQVILMEGTWSGLPGTPLGVNAGLLDQLIPHQ